MSFMVVAVLCVALKPCVMSRHSHFPVRHSQYYQLAGSETLAAALHCDTALEKPRLRHAQSQQTQDIEDIIYNYIEIETDHLTRKQFRHVLGEIYPR